MSNIPNARWSNVVDLTVTPAMWDAHPKITRSNVTSTTFKDLSSATYINYSDISHSTIASNPRKKAPMVERSSIQNSHIFAAQVDRSKLTHSTVAESYVERTKLDKCNVAPRSHIERTKAHTTQFSSSKRIERSKLDDSTIIGETTLERCTVRGSVVADKTRCERSEIDGTSITRSQIERSKIVDCDVMDCKIKRSNFKGMILKYGVWKNGDLVGRTSTEHEVVIRPKHPLPLDADPSIAGSSASLQQTPSIDSSGPGWKAAEVEPGTPSESEDENYSLNGPELSTDEDLPPENVKRSQHHKPTEAALTADINDPPPPYEQ